MIQGTVLVALLSIALLAIAGPTSASAGTIAAGGATETCRTGEKIGKISSRAVDQAHLVR